MPVRIRRAAQGAGCGPEPGVTCVSSLRSVRAVRCLIPVPCLPPLPAGGAPGRHRLHPALEFERVGEHQVHALRCPRIASERDMNVKTVRPPRHRELRDSRPVGTSPRFGDSYRP